MDAIIICLHVINLITIIQIKKEKLMSFKEKVNNFNYLNNILMVNII